MALPPSKIYILTVLPTKAQPNGAWSARRVRGDWRDRVGALMMTSREFHGWEQRAARRSRSRRWVWTLGIGAALAMWIEHGVNNGDPATRWLVFAVAGFALTFLRAPSHFFWRSDATLLARLPIAGQVLFDSGFRRSASDALRLACTLLCGAVPILLVNASATLPYLAIAASLVILAAGAGPATCVGAGALVIHDRARQLLAGSAPAAPPTALLGGLPGFVAALAIVAVVGCAGSLHGDASELPWMYVSAALAVTGVVSCVAARQLWAVHMPAILRDVTTLDRQQLATLQILPATPLHRGVARLLNHASALVLDKQSRLMSRRFPMASVVGALLLVGLASLAIWPRADLSWFATLVVLAVAYATLLAGRLTSAPTALPRLEHTLGLTPSTFRAAHAAWQGTWWGVFICIPGIAAALRSDQSTIAAVGIVVATLVVTAATLRPVRAQ